MIERAWERGSWCEQAILRQLRRAGRWAVDGAKATEGHDGAGVPSFPLAPVIGLLFGCWKLPDRPVFVGDLGAGGCPGQMLRGGDDCA